ncbi:methyltransferase family protein [Leifsonia sp. 2MCAF36]|uniref:methyltransferase family protein n=1 Tax=Leifsonia sp. 2MCAF36 TaxID=3232988 RepID=UPI003F9D382D
MAVPFVLASTAPGVIFDVSVVAFALGEVQQVLRGRRRGAVSSIRAELVFRLVFFAGIVALPLCLRLVPSADIGGLPVFVIGAVIGWLGMLLRWWSFATLGRLFTTVVKTSADQPIVDRGPYRCVRHPSYTGLLLACLGFGLMLGNWAGVITSVVLVLAAVVYRLRGEEQALIEARGSAYLDYARGRARLLPFIW